MEGSGAVRSDASSGHDGPDYARVLGVCAAREALGDVQRQGRGLGGESGGWMSEWVGE